MPILAVIESEEDIIDSELIEDTENGMFSTTRIR